MAFGTGKDGDAGDWSYKPPSKIDEISTPPKQPPAPPVVTAPPAAPPPEASVTPQNIAGIAAGIFPGEKDAGSRATC